MKVVDPYSDHLQGVKCCRFKNESLNITSDIAWLISKFVVSFMLNIDSTQDHASFILNY